MSKVSCSFFDFEVERVAVDEDGILVMMVVKEKKMFSSL